MLVKDGPCAAACRWFLCVLNLFALLSSVLLFLVGVSVEFFQTWFVELLQFAFYPKTVTIRSRGDEDGLVFIPELVNDFVSILNDKYIATILIAFGISIFSISILGFVGIQRQSRGILSWYITFLFLLSTVSVAICVVFYLRLKGVQDRFESYLHERFRDLSRIDDQLRIFNEHLHKNYKCCGYNNGYLDYITSSESKSLPQYCCNAYKFLDDVNSSCEMDSITHKEQINRSCSREFWIQVNSCYSIIMYVFVMLAIFTFVLGMMAGIAPIIRTII